MVDITAEKKKIAADCFRKGSEAMAKENWDYAIDMFTKCVMLVPDNLLYRQTLRGVEQRKYGDNKSGARMAGMKLMGVKGRLKKAKMQKDWDEVDRLAEEGLKINPWDAQLNADVGAACFERGFYEVAGFAYTKALEAEPQNTQYLRQLALTLEARNQFSEAARIWERVAKLDPMDTEARSKATELTASHVIERGGYEGAEGTRDTLADHEIAKRLGLDPKGRRQEAVADGPGQSVEADLQRAIRKDPNNVDNYMKLADHYRSEGRLQEAMEQFQKALELSGGDPDVREQLEDVELQLLRKEYEDLRGQAAQSPEDEALRSQAKELGQRLLQREIEIFEPRIQRHPNDSRLKYELAMRYMKTQQYKKAIPLLQQCVRDQRLAGAALVNLGKCFLAARQPKLARRQLEKAVSELTAKEDEPLLVEAHYWLGRLCEEAGDKAAAEEHYGEVLAIDYEFKDALQRLEKLQQ